MKMRREIYDGLLADIAAVKDEMERTGLQPLPGKRIDTSDLAMRDMWDLYQKTLIDRGNEDHPWHHRKEEGVLGRVLEFTDRSPYFLYNDEDLDDSHIETAFRRMLEELRQPAAPAP